MRFVTLTTVTPELAEVLLRRRNPGSIPVDEEHVSKIEQDIRNYRWRIECPAIWIGPTGLINDGHHRLTAISRAGISVETLLAYETGR